MRTPGDPAGTRKAPVRGGSSSVRAQTCNQASPGAPVQVILWPDMRQPPAVRRATVAGRPPRVGVPSAGSTRREFISAPVSTAARPMRVRSNSRRSSPAPMRCWWISCIARIRPVEAQAAPTAATASAASRSPAPPPPSRVGTVSASTPAACSAARLSCGKLPSRSWRIAACATATSSGTGRAGGLCEPSIRPDRPAALAAASSRVRSGGIGHGAAPVRGMPAEADFYAIGSASTVFTLGCCVS